MGIKKLKKENDYLNLTLVDMLSKFDPSKTKKYTQFLVKQLSNRFKGQLEYNNPEEIDWDRKEVEKLVPFDSFENSLVRTFVCDYLFSWGQMDNFVDFCNLMERGLTKEKDISKYDSWEMLERELFGAKNRASIKKAEKEIQIISSDERYLIFKPLTYLASTTYGYQTKWCTAMITDPMYFYTHSKGILIYLIDRERNKRFAFYKRITSHYDIVEDHEDLLFTSWNEEDKKIDSFQTGLPYEILKIIADQMDTTNPKNIANYKYFSEDELKLMVNYTDFPESHLYVDKVEQEDRPINTERTEAVTHNVMRRLTARPRLATVPMPEPDPIPVREETEQDVRPIRNVYLDLIRSFPTPSTNDNYSDDLP